MLGSILGITIRFLLGERYGMSFPGRSQAYELGPMERSLWTKA